MQQRLTSVEHQIPLPLREGVGGGVRASNDFRMHGNRRRDVNGGFATHVAASLSFVTTTRVDDHLSAPDPSPYPLPQGEGEKKAAPYCIP